MERKLDGVGQDSGDVCHHATRSAALCAARVYQSGTGEPHYVVRTDDWLTSGWTVTRRMPMLGVWYTSDGVRHG